jgi:uncharacterized protein YjbI with pentapeptide repeats
MASPEHAKNLKKGVDHWNQWKKDNLDTRPDLSKANLTGTKLIHANLSGAILDGIKLFGPCLYERGV